MVTMMKTPYTGQDIPSSLINVEIKILGEHPTRDGVSFAAEVHLDGKVIGTIENEGRGGGTWFHQHTREVGIWWAERIKEFQPVAEYSAEEELADALYDNAAMKRDLDRKRSPLVRWNGDNDDIRIYRGKWDPALEQGMRDLAAKEGATAERWVKGKGWVAL